MVVCGVHVGVGPGCVAYSMNFISIMMNNSVTASCMHYGALPTVV